MNFASQPATIPSRPKQISVVIVQKNSNFKPQQPENVQVVDNPNGVRAIMGRENMADLILMLQFQFLSLSFS
jgi:hypothetical protein